MATLGLKEMGKFLWEGREKGGKRREKGKGKDKKITKFAVAGSAVRAIVGYKPTTIELAEWSPNQFCHLGL